MATPYPAGIDVDLDRLQVEFSDIVAAAARLQGVAHRTPVMRSQTLDERVGGRVALKCESFQRTGAFKIRGAYNALGQLSEEQRRRGVLTFSSGTHAQAAAPAGRCWDRRPGRCSDAAASQARATRPGAPPSSPTTARDRRGARHQARRGDRLRRGAAHDHPHIVAGQGTAALELFQDAGPPDSCWSVRRRRARSGSAIAAAACRRAAG
jgi:threonine dehydratase